MVLVEGEDDRAAVIGTARAMGYDLESLSVSVIPCFGKSNMYTAAAVFISFEIPTYCVWDGDAHLGETGGTCEKCGKALDKKADPRENHRLMRLLMGKEEDWPEHIETTSACFKSDLESTMRGEIGGELFDELLEEQMAIFTINKKKHAIKNPAIVASLLQHAKESGKSCKSLEAIVAHALALRQSINQERLPPPRHSIRWPHHAFPSEQPSLCATVWAKRRLSSTIHD